MAGRRFLFILMSLSALVSCGSGDSCFTDKALTCDEPVFLTWDELRQDIVPEYGNAAPLKRPGKLLNQGNQLLVVDRYRGFHIFDISDRQNPVRQYYVPVPGVTDVMLLDGYFYANALTDIVSIKVSDLESRQFNPQTSVFRDVGRFGVEQDAFVPEGIEWKFRKEDVERYNDQRNNGILIGANTVLNGQWRYGERLSAEDVALEGASQ